tara:strand:+ start:360 stop:581 length:222 start_codon:yes stop_codon:yes gene_type:complete
MPKSIAPPAFFFCGNKFGRGGLVPFACQKRHVLCNTRIGHMSNNFFQLDLRQSGEGDFGFQTGFQRKEKECTS